MKTMLLVILKALTQIYLNHWTTELFWSQFLYKKKKHPYVIHSFKCFVPDAFWASFEEASPIRTAENHRLTFILMAIWGSPARLVLTAETEHTRIKKQSHDLAPCAKKRVICIRVKDLTAQQIHTTERMLKQLTRLATSRPPPFKMIK